MVKEPQKLGEADIEKLKALVAQFPYFSLGHNLLVKALHNTHHYDYDRFLKQAALQAGSRAVLYNLVNNLPLETESEALLVQPIENLQIDSRTSTSKVETPETIAQDDEQAITVEITTEPKEEEGQTIAAVIPAKDPNQIYEEEKLVESTGNFVKFVPKVLEVEEQEKQSLIPAFSENNESVLESFDIESIEQEEQATAYTPMLVEDEIPALEIIPTQTTIESPVIIPEPQAETDSSFFDWIAQKEKADEEVEEKQIENIHPPVVLPPTKMEEDLAFVDQFNQNLGEQAHNSLHAIVEENISRAIPVMEELPLTPTLIDSIAIETIASSAEPIGIENAADPLQSLYTHEVNEYLAPLYNQVSYNETIFEDSFMDCFGGNKSAKIEWTEPFASLKPKAEEPKAKAEPIIAKPEYKPETPNVKPKTADLPTPKIARDPSTVESILEKFMRENPSIARPKSEFYSPMNMAKQSAEESEEIISETLAQIYTRQGLYKKAIVMYEKLGLHNPDKLPYFAGLILQIKSAHNIE